MSKEFGIYPENITPKMWWGARAIITRGQFDIPYDRKSFDGDSSDTDDFFFWINNTAMPKVIELVQKRDTKEISFDSEGGRFHCEAADRDSGGYLYIGCWTAKEFSISSRKERSCYDQK